MTEKQRKLEGQWACSADAKTPVDIASLPARRALYAGG